MFVIDGARCGPRCGHPHEYIADHLEYNAE